jgi:hypothetical protein
VLESIQAAIQRAHNHAIKREMGQLLRAQDRTSQEGVPDGLVIDGPDEI